MSGVTATQGGTIVRTKALLTMLGVLIVTTSAAVLGGCTGATSGSTTASMAPAPSAKATAGATSYTPVTDQRLVNPEPENWLMYRRTYDGWGYAGGTPQYDDLPTWKYATPHNIQRWTARTDTTGGQSCSNACHNSPATPEGFFLRAVDLQAHPDEAEANAPYIVPDSAPTEWGK